VGLASCTRRLIVFALSQNYASDLDEEVFQSLVRLLDVRTVLFDSLASFCYRRDLSTSTAHTSQFIKKKGEVVLIGFYHTHHMHPWQIGVTLNW
jgi:hypothetical protein